MSRLIYGQTFDSGKVFQDSVFCFSNTGSLILAQSMLNNIYDCQFQDFERLVLDKEITIKASGKSYCIVSFDHTLNTFCC